MTTSPLNALAARLESVEALDGPGQTAGRAVRGLIPDGAPKDVLSGAWLGHAVHPILTDIPIGAWTSSVLLDWIGGQGSQSASDRLILTGVLAAGATVVHRMVGLGGRRAAESRGASFRARPRRRERDGDRAHDRLLARAHARRARARQAAVARRLGCPGAGGWLGGHLSYTLGAGVTASSRFSGAR